MSHDNVIIDSFSLAGYRSFGEEIQRFEYFSKINLFIGQNNCGKSNVLKFINEAHPQINGAGRFTLEPLDNHVLKRVDFIAGKGFPLDKDSIRLLFPNSSERSIEYIQEVFKVKVAKDQSNLVWFEYGSDLNLIVNSSWKEAFDTLNDHAFYYLWSDLDKHTFRHGISRGEHWFPESLMKLTPRVQAIHSVMIPAIREIGKIGSVSDDFSGEGIIERLVKLQNPKVQRQNDKKKFSQINNFLQNVTDNSSAIIEIPHDRETILVHMDGKTLPLESLGAGIHEVIILASAATILEDTVICMEEPELHLNPILQKKLVRYLDEATSNQYFITTHSAALMDTPNAEIYHINLEDGASKVRRVTSDTHKSEVCADLGYHPSDLLQSNCIIWVEGPSDRIYLNHWIKEVDSKLVEGIHYSIMFYGGRLASHLSGYDMDEAIDDFISLRRMNRRAVIVIDSDREKPHARINATKTRLKKEFDDGAGFAWITAGREIENYFSADSLKEAIESVHSTATVTSKLGKYDNCLSIKTAKGKKTQASKVRIAKYIARNKTVDLGALDLSKKVTDLVDFIKDSNPQVLVDFSSRD